MDTRMIDTAALGWTRLAQPRAIASKQHFDLVATWQTGVVQPTPQDYANLIREGYVRRAVIHACVSLLAASAAVPRPVLKSGDDIIDKHRLLDLLARPNVWQSGMEFTEMLLTHLLITGNAYVELVRAQGLVVQMGLLRPDRIQIKPGARKEQDLFLYDIGGGGDPRPIPQPDVIHFKLPNPFNDFYGLSPIESVFTEANLDADMTMLAKAFFDNAGVPLGILTVSGKKLGEDDKKELKKTWRTMFGRASSNVRRFFDLFILNADEAKYQELGHLPKDLEMESLRGLTETRMCSAFKVPPGMVGTMTGLKFHTYSNAETDEKVFWRYGVSYYLALIRERMNLELCPEFNRTGERLELGYDTASVPALAEDNTDKLTAVAGLVNSGGFTPNAALALVGLPPVEDGDFYVRKPLQTIERPVRNGKAHVVLLDRPRANTKARASLQQGIETMRARVAEKMQPPVTAYFEAQAAAVRAAVSGFGKADTKAMRVDDIFPAGQDEELTIILNGFYLEVDSAAWTLLEEALGLSEYDAAGSVTQRILMNGAARVVEINGVTKAAIQEVLIEAEQQGYNLFQTVQGVADDGFAGLNAVVEETYRGRAETIARTETAYATNDATLGRYREAGVEQIDIIDGDGDDCCASRNGTRVPISSSPDLCHPNCTLVVLPVV